MKRILFFAIPEKGHINPMIGPAKWLQSMGHDVCFCTRCKHDRQLNAAGLRQLELPGTRESQRASSGAWFAAQVRDKVWLRAWIRRLLIDEAPASVPSHARAIDTFHPDVIVVDPMIYPAVIAAHAAGLPWVALSNSLNPVLDQCVRSELLDTVAAIAAAREALFERYAMRVRFSGCDAISPYLTVAFTTREFVGRDVPGVHMVGPSLPPGDRGDEIDFDGSLLVKEGNRVYASFGSQLYHQPELYRKLVRVTGTLGLQLILSVNSLLHSAELGPLPPHVIALPYAPQLQLLPVVNAFVTHGGANSVMEALYFGTPMLISPICNDQFHQAYFIEQARAGKVLDLSAAGDREIAACLDELLHDAALKDRLRSIADSYKADGAKRAAELIDAL